METSIRVVKETDLFIEMRISKGNRGLWIRGAGKGALALTREGRFGLDAVMKMTVSEFSYWLSTLAEFLKEIKPAE